MVKETVVKTKFSQLNDKRFYFPDGVASFPFGHHKFKRNRLFLKEKGPKNGKIFLGRKISLIRHGEKGT